MGAKVNFVDVQQGDGAVIESPDGKIMLVDGGDNQLFARYLAARFRGTSEANPKEIACILVTHGDADHFAGLTKIHESETNPEPRKRLFIAPKRVYHNGLVKRPSKDENEKTIPEKELLGPTKVVDGETVLTDLVGSLLDVPDMVSPILSVVSSGDESAKKEYIHPRATLMGALGRHSRVDEPLILVTELIAFFNLEGWARLTNKKKDEERGEFFAFSRTAYGIVKTRTNGSRLLIYTDSGKANMKEAYCYSLDGSGSPVPSSLRRA